MSAGTVAYEAATAKAEAEAEARASVVQPTAPRVDVGRQLKAEEPVAVEAEWDVEAPPVVEPVVEPEVQPEPEIQPPVVPEVQPTPEVAPEPETAPPVLEDDTETVSAEEVDDLFADDDLNIVQAPDPAPELPAPVAEAEPSKGDAEKRAEIERLATEGASVPETMLEALRRRLEGATSEELDQMLVAGEAQAAQRFTRNLQEDERISFLGKTEAIYGGDAPFTVPSVLDDGSMATVSVQPINPESLSDGWRVVADVAGKRVDPIELQTYEEAVRHAQEEYGAELDEGVVEFQADPIEQAQITPEVMPDIPAEELVVPPRRRRPRAPEMSLSQMFTGRLAPGQMEEAERMTGKIDDPTVRRFWGKLRSKEGGAHLAEALAEAWDGPDRAVLQGAGISGPDDVDGFAQALTNRNRLFHKTAVEPFEEAEDLWDEEQRRRAQELRGDEYDDEVPFEPSRVRNKSKERRAAEKYTRDDMVAAAVSQFGLTENPVEAGYILHDGSMLNFSEGEPNQRSLDHRGVAMLGRTLRRARARGCSSIPSLAWDTIRGICMTL